MEEKQPRKTAENFRFDNGHSNVRASAYMQKSMYDAKEVERLMELYASQPTETKEELPEVEVNFDIELEGLINGHLETVDWTEHSNTGIYEVMAEARIEIKQLFKTYTTQIITKLRAEMKGKGIVFPSEEIVIHYIEKELGWRVEGCAETNDMISLYHWLKSQIKFKESEVTTRDLMQASESSLKEDWNDKESEIKESGGQPMYEPDKVNESDAVGFAKAIGYNYEYRGKNKWQQKDNEDTIIIDVREYSTEELYQQFLKEKTK